MGNTVANVRGRFRNGREPPLDPAGDRTAYEPVGADGSATVDFSAYETTQQLSNLSIYLGSMDKYNYITFYAADGDVLASLSGKDFPGSNGDRGASITNRRAYFLFAPSDHFGYVTLSSRDMSFEFDTIAVGSRAYTNIRPGAVFMTMPSAVPESATWALLVIGVGLAGGVLRARRLTKTATV